MDTIDDQDDMPFVDRIDAQREIIRQSLDEIAAEVGVALAEAAITCPVYMTVPSSGNSLATVATPLDPPVEDWSKVMAIVCRIIERRVGTGELRGRELPCAMANATMGAADVTAD